MAIGIFENEEEKKREWAEAKKQLTDDNGVLLENGSKLKRKDSGLKHSFMVVDNRILAFAGQGKYLGKGLSAAAKLAEDENAGLWALKIRNPAKATYGRTVSDDADAEEKIATDLGRSLQSTRRALYPEGKHYLPFVYLGSTVSKYLEENASLSTAKRYELAIKTALALNRFHTGQDSKTQTKYGHGDLNLGNITIDEGGNVHLIDYGGSYTITNPHHPDMRELEAITKIILPTELYSDTCKLALMSDLPNNDKNKAQKGIIYLSAENSGKYILRDIHRDIKEGELASIDLSNLEQRLNDSDLERSIVSAIKSSDKYMAIDNGLYRLLEQYTTLEERRAYKADNNVKFPWDSALQFAQELMRIQSELGIIQDDSNLKELIESAINWDETSIHQGQKKEDEVSEGKQENVLPSQTIKSRLKDIVQRINSKFNDIAGPGKEDDKTTNFKPGKK